MNTFITTLIKINTANFLKTLTGIGSGILTAATIAAELPGIPKDLKNAAGIIVGIATVLGAHGLHIAEPPTK